MQAASSSAGWRVLAGGLAFPEGPVFTADGALWCVELNGAALVRIAGEKVERFAVGGTPNGLAADSEGGLVFCDAERNALRRFEPATRAVEDVAISGTEAYLAAPNDLAFDSAGALVFTCPGSSRETPTGEIWCRNKNGRLKLIMAGLRFPNGLAFVDGGRKLVVAETYGQRLWIGDWDDISHHWIDPRPFAELPGPPTGPDGMALGADGVLHVALFGRGRVVSLTLDGVIVGENPTPGSRPTNCAFDPSGTLGLVVTEAERGEVLSSPPQGMGVGLFTGSVS